MKIHLTKEEWEFLKYILSNLHRIQDIDTSKLINLIYEKLGREWIDEEEEEILKFTMGFAYRSKAERDKDE